MKYLTGLYALNLKSPDGTPGDWHYSAIDWSNIQLCETEDSPFGPWGICEAEVPCHGKMFVANHIRACLDLIAQGFFSSAGGMREYFIGDDSFNDLIFNKVWELRGQANWQEINSFMGKEYLCDWLDFKENMGQTERQKAIDSFLHFINSDGENPFILKGGTALSQCYQLDRLPEDICFDAEADTDHMLLNKAQEFCDEFSFLYRVDEDTLTTQRVFINYKNGSTPLKVEVSYRRKSISQESITCIGGIRVYGINELAALTAIAYSSQNKIQDLYDLLCICTTYIDDLSSTTKDAVCRALEYKDLDQFDYLVRTQNDPLIDKAKLEAMFVKTFDAVGLVTPTRSAHAASISNEAQGSKERDVQEQRIRYADGKPIAIVDSRDKKTNTSSNPDERVRYADVKPISIVDSLDDLEGPVSGEIELPLSIYWGPGGGVFSLDEPGDVFSIYQAVLSEGKLEDLIKFLNKDILIEVWSDLSLPIRVAKMWQAKYPIDLKGNKRADW